MTSFSGGGESRPNLLLAHWQQDVLPRLTPELVYDHPCHHFQRSASRWRGGSPFRQSKSGTSFALWPDTLRFYDSGCGFAGDPIAYVHSLRVGRWEYPKGQDFVEALRELSRRAGTEHCFPERSPPEERHIEILQKWEARRAIFQCTYHLCATWLWSEAGEAARNHLIASRGFTPEQIKSLDLGLYLDMGQVASTLKAQGHHLGLAEECGILTRKWEGYITFPWRTPQGEPLTLYGHWPGKPLPLKKDHRGWKPERDQARRAWAKLPEVQQALSPWCEPTLPKKYACWNPSDGAGTWLSTKESPLYFERTRQAQLSEVVLVEGVTDAAIAQVHGDARVVACVAASLSHAQIQTLVRHRIERVIICLDPDSAGDKGVQSCIKGLLAAGITPWVAPRLPVAEGDDGDPDRFILGRGIEAWKSHTALNQATHGLRWVAQHLIATQADPNRDDAKQALLVAARAWVKANPLHPDFAQDLDIFFWPSIADTVGQIQPAWIEGLKALEQESFSQPTLEHLTEGSTQEPTIQKRWSSPVSDGGELGYWRCDKEGNHWFEPMCNFDFQVVRELSDSTGGGVVLELKRSIDEHNHRIVLNSTDYTTPDKFVDSLKRSLGCGVVCKLSKWQLADLIHTKIHEYRLHGGNTTH
jgi:putative DNA primase/helicase